MKIVIITKRNKDKIIGVGIYRLNNNVWNSIVEEAYNPGLFYKGINLKKEIGYKFVKPVKNEFIKNIINDKNDLYINDKDKCVCKFMKKIYGIEGNQIDKIKLLNVGSSNEIKSLRDYFGVNYIKGGN